MNSKEPESFGQILLRCKALMDVAQRSVYDAQQSAQEARECLMTVTHRYNRMQGAIEGKENDAS